jgi:hypothetical protein
VFRLVGFSFHRRECNLDIVVACVCLRVCFVPCSFSSINAMMLSSTTIRHATVRTKCTRLSMW